MSSYRLVALIVMMLLLALSLPPHYTLTSEAQSPAFKVNVKVNWGINWEVRSEGDAARAVCEAGEYIYVVGTGGSARVEMRFKSDGSLAIAMILLGFSCCSRVSVALKCVVVEEASQVGFDV